MLTALAIFPAFAADHLAASLADFSLEQLANIEVTSVSKQAERLTDAPASIFVITNDDIRRAGVRTLPEALRLAPNLQVARVNATKYAISARGFNNAIGNKLLVLIDGRTVYTPLFSGVFWDQQDVMLEDVERIEVISGPGATLWGANAVNGVINVITRAAKDTQGALVSLGLGNRDEGAAFRYGGKLGESGHYRVYGKSAELQNTKRANGTSVTDGWQMGQIGFRADWRHAGDGFTLQGDTYSGKSEFLITPTVVVPPITVSGTNLLARWTRQLSDGSDIRLQAYVDHTDRDDPLFFRPRADIFDIDFQHGIPLGAHKVLWGGGYRHARDDVGAGIAFSRFIPENSRLEWMNLFVQDEIRLTAKLDFTAGIKLERNDYTGWEFLPSLRFAWKPQDQRLVWGAVSRAVRAPSRFDRDVFFPPAGPFVIRGGPNFVSEVANVFEVGYRAQPSRVLTYSITAFRHDWERLRSATSQPAPIFFVNENEGFVNGVEAWATFQPTRSWRLSGGFTTLHEKLSPRPGNNETLANDPDHQWMLRSMFNLTERHEFDVMIRRTGSLPFQRVPAYTAVDARWGWHVGRNTEVSLTLQNLFDREHAEFGAAPGRSEFGRSLFLKLLWRI
ncbi:MAG TPA: TonB-dependent receptor [Burkholderiales bacterium]|nr:TonB-dependent receptor [Burkholderiales bacterium]